MRVRLVVLGGVVAPVFYWLTMQAPRPEGWGAFRCAVCRAGYWQGYRPAQPRAAKRAASRCPSAPVCRSSPLRGGGAGAPRIAHTGLEPRASWELLELARNAQVALAYGRKNPPKKSPKNSVASARFPQKSRRKRRTGTSSAAHPRRNVPRGAPTILMMNSTGATNAAK